MTIDLRSDTVTKPTDDMLAAMMQAQVGDDVFEEDPSIIELETYSATLFNHEAALFCPSGTMTNQIAIRLHTVPGSEVICHEESHVYNYEGGGIAVNALSSVKLLRGNRGRINPNDIKAAVHGDDVHKPVTSLVCLEDTSNRGGGCVYNLNDIQTIRLLTKDLSLPLHCDGARLFNAFEFRGDHPEDYGPLFDTISICLSKGLGAPVGSLLIGSKAHIKKARRIRKVLGGGMRQAGILAAGGLFALNHHVDRLSEDHHRAKVIAENLQGLSFIDNILPVETNIVVFELSNNHVPKVFIEKLKDQGIWAVPFGGQYIRFVTHLNFTDVHLERLVDVLKMMG